MNQYIHHKKVSNFKNVGENWKYTGVQFGESSRWNAMYKVSNNCM